MTLKLSKNSFLLGAHVGDYEQDDFTTWKCLELGFIFFSINIKLYKIEDCL